MTFATILGTFGITLWIASQWWEKGLATPLGAAQISPSGCYMVQAYKPFWVLPDIFHPEAHPDELDNPKWFPWWENPGFYRLYDNRSGELISQSNIHDLAAGSGPLFWGTRWLPEVSAGLIPIGPNLSDCIGDRPTTP